MISRISLYKSLLMAPGNFSESRYLWDITGENRDYGLHARGALTKPSGLIWPSVVRSCSGTAILGRVKMTAVPVENFSISEPSAPVPWRSARPW